MTTEQRNGALQGIVVLDLSRVVAGPYCGMVLADLGAEVIKVEIPGTGEESRTGAPFIKGESTYFHAINRNKKGITLNLRKPEAKEIFFELVKHADAVIENFTPGTMSEFGLSYEAIAEVNPRIIMASISGFGQKDSPYVHKVAYDSIAQAMGGLMSINGYPDSPPTKVGTVIGDLGAALFAAIGITGALFERARSGQGQHVDVALTDSVFSLLEHAVVRYTATGEVAERIGSKHPTLSPFNNYKTKNGTVAIGTASNAVAFRLADAVGRSDLKEDVRYSSNAERTKNAGCIEPILEKWVSVRTTSEVLEILERFDVPCAPVYTVEDAVMDPHFTIRGMLVEVEHPIAGTLKVVGPTIKFSRTPCQVTCAGPMLGQHNEEIYKGWLQMTEEVMANLEEKKVI